MQLRSIESGYSGWLGAAGIINYRSGTWDTISWPPSRLHLRLPCRWATTPASPFVARPVFLDSGQADGKQPSPCRSRHNARRPLADHHPEPIGTMIPTATTPPAQQNAVGLGGEVQLAFPHLALAGGYTPYGFLVATFTGRAQWKPGNGPFTFNFIRDSVRDTQLSYAGLRDPHGNTLGNPGADLGRRGGQPGQGAVSRKATQSRAIYVGVGGQYLTGYNVETQ